MLHIGDHMSIILRSDYFCLKITLSLNVISILFFSSYTEKGVNAEQELLFFFTVEVRNLQNEAHSHKILCFLHHTMFESKS